MSSISLPHPFSHCVIGKGCIVRLVILKDRHAAFNLLGRRETAKTKRTKGVQ